MKKLDRLILRSFIGPLVLTFAIAVFVLLMQFVWKYIDDLVGKGLEFGVIAELLTYASATFVPMALPIAVLFASIMTMGNFGEKYELVAMKAGGISVSRVMRPLAIVVLLITGVAFYFANNVMPVAMLKYRTTLYDVTHKKPAVNIRPGEYYSEIDGYVIHVGSKDADGSTMRDIIIYDHSRGVNETDIIVAKDGVMSVTADNRYLRFVLHNGYTYSESFSGDNYQRRPFTTVGFDVQTISFDISSFALSRSSEDFFKGSYQMMNIAQLDSMVVRLEERLGENRRRDRVELTEPLHAWRHYVQGDVTVTPPDTNAMVRMRASRARTHTVNNARNISRDIHTHAELRQADREYINRHRIEWQRKYTLSIACLLMFLVGAPFGSIVRKGGLGMPLVASVIFFVIYYVVGMIAEKAVREGVLGPEGMWVSSLVLLPIGIALTLQATTDSPLFDAAFWRHRFRRKRK